MRNCDPLQEDLKAYQDGQLPPLLRLRVRLHLKRCESCRKEIEEMGRIGRELHNMDMDNDRLDPSLRARILASIPDGLPDPPDPAITPTWRRKPVMVWGSLATAALALVLFYPAIQNLNSPRVSQEDMAASMAPPGAEGSVHGATSSQDAPASSKAAAPSDDVASGGSSKITAGTPPMGNSEAPNAPKPSNMAADDRSAAAASALSPEIPPNMPATGSFQSNDGHIRADAKTAARAEKNQTAPSAPTSNAGTTVDSVSPSDHGTTYYSVSPAPPSTTPGDRLAGGGRGITSAPVNGKSAESQKARSASSAALLMPGSAPKANPETSLIFFVLDIPDRSKQVAQIVKDAGGQTVPAPVSTGNKSKVVLLDVEVPVAKFDAVVHRLSQLKGLQRDQRLNDYYKKLDLFDGRPLHSPQTSAPLQPKEHGGGGRSTTLGKQSVTDMGTASPPKAESGRMPGLPSVPLQPLTPPSKSQKSPAQAPDKAPAYYKQMPAVSLQHPSAAAPTVIAKAEPLKKSKPALHGVIHVELKEAPK